MACMCLVIGLLYIIPTCQYESMMAIFMLIWYYIGWLNDDKGFFYVLLEWHVLWVKVKYVVSCLGWFVSLDWCMYECEYVMSWLRMLKFLSVEFINDIRP